MHKILLVPILLSAAICLTACSSSSSQPIQTPPLKDELTNLVNQILQKEQGVQEPEALETIEQGVVYEGLSYATKQAGHWMIQQSDVAKSDTETPFTTHVLSGEEQNGTKNSTGSTQV